MCACYDPRRPAAHEGIEHEIAGVARREDDSLQQCDGFLRRVLAEGFFVVLRRGEGPDILHLLVRVGALHVGVVETVAALLVFRGPENRLGGMREVAAGEVRWWVGFLPRDLVQHLHAELLHGVADGKDDVMRAADPKRAVGLQECLAALEPCGVELVIELGAAGLVPLAFIDLHHLARVAGDAAVGEKVGRVGEDEVEDAVGVLGTEAVHHLETVAVIKENAAGVVAVGELARLDDAGRLIDDGVLGTESVVVGRIDGRIVGCLAGLLVRAGDGTDHLFGCGALFRHALIGSIRGRKGSRRFWSANQSAGRRLRERGLQKLRLNA